MYVCVHVIKHCGVSEQSIIVIYILIKIYDYKTMIYEDLLILEHTEHAHKRAQTRTNAHKWIQTSGNIYYLNWHRLKY